MKIRGSHLIALAILAGVGGWMLTGKLIVGGQVDPSQPTISEREASRTDAAFNVRVTIVEPKERFSVLPVRGRTKADSLVSVRAETAGTVEQRMVDKGQMVKPGDLLCVIDKGIRKTQVEQAMAQLKQAKEDYESTVELVSRGFATKSRLRGLKTAYDAAVAALAAAEQDAERTEIRATVVGMVQQPMAEPGDNLAKGGVCVTLMDRDPMLFSGQVSERDIGSISIGMPAQVTLITNEKVQGQIVYIAPVADAKTRTFEVEIALPNQDDHIRDGLTAQAHIPLKPTEAYALDSSWIVLADDGQIGVRTIDDTSKVVFKPVSIIAQGNDGIWVQGLVPGTKIITLGQNYVTEGETVNAVQATADTEKTVSGSSTFEGPDAKDPQK